METALIALLVGLVTAVIGYSSAQSTNETNTRLTRETNQSNQQIQREVNDLQQQLAGQANTWSVEQWNRENQFNSPSSQMQRLREAGINPSLIFGNGGLMNEAAGSPAVNMANVNAMRNNAPQINNPLSNLDPVAASQIALNDAQSEAIRHNTLREDEKQGSILSQLQSSIEQMHASTSNLREMLDGIKSDNVKKHVEAFILDKTKEDAIQQFKDNASITHNEAQYFVLDLMSNVGLREAQEELARHQIELTDAQKANINKLTFVTQKFYEMDKEKFDALKPYLSQNAFYQTNQEYYKALQGMVDYETASKLKDLIIQYGDIEHVLGLIEAGSRVTKNVAYSVSTFLPNKSVLVTD